MTLSASYINTPVGGDCLQFRKATIMFQSKKKKLQQLQLQFLKWDRLNDVFGWQKGPPEGIAFEIMHSV